MKVALFGVQSYEVLNKIIPPLLKCLEEKGFSYQVEEKYYKMLREKNGIEIEAPTFAEKNDLWKDLDLFFSFGGDGTILSAVTLVQDLGVPIVGVNTGRLGYLAGISKQDFLSNIDTILSRNYQISPRSLLEVEVTDWQTDCPFALNELSVLRKETTSMITVDSYINGQFVNTFWADGLIVATPTGSTGYSLSCNGPIISPETNNLVITPIAPHNLNVRPLVIPDSEEIQLKVRSRVPEFSMSLDARLNSLNVAQEITVRKADFKINIVQLKNTTYLETLRKKLNWGSDLRN